MATTTPIPPTTTTTLPQPPSTSTLNGSSTLSPVKSNHRPRSSQDSSRITRPPIGSRKSSGTIIVPRDSPSVEPQNETYEADDARAMSPRRSSVEIDRMGTEGRQEMVEQAQTLQSNLLEIIERVDSVKSEQEKLEGGNKFLQS